MVNLHNHSYYSLLDGVVSPSALVKAAKDLGMMAIAITDHGNVHGVIEFYKEAKSEGIKPIIGCEVYVSEAERTEKGILKTKKQYINTIADRSHLVLLAKSARGFENVVKILNDAWENGFHIKPRTDLTVLRLYSEDLIAIPCASGSLGRFLLAHEYDIAKQYAMMLRDIFPDFYIEIQANLEDKIVNQLLQRLSSELSIPAVITSDTHFLTGQEVIHKSINKVKYRYLRNNDDDGYGICRLMSEKEVRSAVSYLDAKFVEKCIENTMKIAEQCNVELDMSPKLPEFKCDNPKEFLRQLAYAGANARGVKDFERLENELSVITSKNLETYFLIVHDFITYAKRADVYVGPGRGSGAGSLVSYCLGITSVDPTKHALLFERFLNPERNELPDLDIDFEDRGRQKIIKYVTEKYGNVSKICTFSYFKARSAFKEACRILGVPFNKANDLSKTIPYTDDLTEASFTLEKIDEEVPGVYELTRELMGIPRHVSQHAAGVVIAPVNTVIPSMVINGEKVCQWDMKAVSDYGLLKFDFLGLRTLSVIHDVERAVGRKSYDFDDVSVWNLYQQGDTRGVFQAEGSGMTNLIKRMNVSNIEELCAAIALYRPGPLQAGLVDAYVKNKKNGFKQSTFPGIDNILQETFGVMVYQEQIMRIAQRLAGYSAGEADLLRKAIGKKRSDIMAAERAKFLSRCVLPESDAVRLWNAIEKFAAYSFNKSHSMAYAYLSYITAYLKKHYLLEFWCAVLNSVADDFDKLIEYCAYTKKWLEEPTQRNASIDFKVSGRKIVYGLRGIKGVGLSGARLVMKHINLPLDQIIDKVNKRIVESLLVAGMWGQNGITVYEKKTGIKLNMDKSTIALRPYYEVKGVKEHKSRTGKKFYRIALAGDRVVFANKADGVVPGSKIEFVSTVNNAGYEWIRNIKVVG